jgi:tryptophan synthase
LVSIADSFIYVVSVSGVTGARSQVSNSLPDLVARIKKETSIPLAVGFGVSSREQFVNVGGVVEGVVIGSRIVEEMGKGGDVAGNVGRFARGMHFRAY